MGIKMESVSDTLVDMQATLHLSHKSTKHSKVTSSSSCKKQKHKHEANHPDLSIEFTASPSFDKPIIYSQTSLTMALHTASPVSPACLNPPVVLCSLSNLNTLSSSDLQTATTSPNLGPVPQPCATTALTQFVTALYVSPGNPPAIPTDDTHHSGIPTLSSLIEPAIHAAASIVTSAAITVCVISI